MAKVAKVGKVAIVTDSASDVAAPLLRQWEIAMVPLTVHLDDEAYRDQLDLSGPEFVEALRQAKGFPRTAAPSPALFRDVYQNLLERGYDAVVSIHLGSRLSATYENACQAARMVEAGRVTVVDGQSASLGTGLLVLWAARAARLGWTASHIVDEVNALRQALLVYFTLSTLEYLARGGRIGRAAQFVGTLMQMKPVLGLKDGEVRPIRRVLGHRQLAPAVLAEVHREVPSGALLMAFVQTVESPLDMMRAIQEDVRGRYHVIDEVSGEIGPVVLGHAGPGALGVVLLPLGTRQAAVWTSAAEGAIPVQ